MLQELQPIYTKDGRCMSIEEYVNSHDDIDIDQIKQDIVDLQADKADKVEDATAGDVAGLDASGNIFDTGISLYANKTYDYAPVLNIKNALPVPAVDCKVKVEPIQDLHGYDHPWVGGAGKNKCDWNVSPTANALSIALSPNTYTISAKSTLSAGNWYFRFTDVNDNYISSLSAVGLNGYTFAESGWIYGGLNSQSVTFTIPSDCKLLEVGKLNADGTIPAQIEVGSSATSWEPYSNICPISGIDEVEIGVTGKNLFDGIYNVSYPLHFDDDVTLIVSADAVSSGTPQYAYYNANNELITFGGLGTAESQVSGRIARIITYPKEAYYIKFTSARSDHYQIEIGNTNTAFEPYNPNSHTTTISLPQTVYDGEVDVTEGSADSRYGYIASYNGETLPGAWISDRDEYTGSNSPTTGAEVCYELATPTTILFDPTDVELLKGTNVVSANTGDISMIVMIDRLADLEDRVTALENA